MAAPASRPEGSESLGGLDSSVRRPVRPLSELRLLRALGELEAQLRDVGEPAKAAKVAVRMAAALMGADESCVALLVPGLPDASVVFSHGTNRTWERRILAEFARGAKTSPPTGAALARLKRRGRAWGALALRWRSSEPDWAVRNALTRIASITNSAIETIERQRVAEVRSRLDRKIMEQLRPKDLFYQILDGLRSLTGYDHTGILLAAAEDAGQLEIAAEQVAWRKGKGARVGRAVGLTEASAAGLAAGGVWGFSRDGGDYVPWDAATPAGVMEWVRHGVPAPEDGAPPEAELICAPLVAGAGLAAVLRISAQHPGAFGSYECELLESFLPHALVALQNAQRAESLTGKVVEAERKHAMAELARGVSHDVNNALGSILPLVQQLREEAELGQLNPATLASDLAQIEHSVQVCTRIFGGMLRMARRSAPGMGTPRARVRAAAESALAIVGDSCQRNGIRAVVEVPEDLPEIPLTQGEADQLLLNLIVNARDAMLRDGGELVIRAKAPAGSPEPGVEIEVSDTGIGIPAGVLQRIFEPFFTTKANGNGLGLAVCRSIVWQAQGRMYAESPARKLFVGGGPGSRFTIQFPACPPAAPPKDLP